MIMHTELFKKDRTDILKYLQSLGEDRKIYSAHRDSIRPLFPDMDGYIYATEEEIILVLMDPGTNKRFDQKDDMAWDLALTCEFNRFKRLPGGTQCCAIIRPLEYICIIHIRSGDQAPSACMIQ